MKTCTNCTILKPWQIVKSNKNMECIECGKKFHTNTTVDNVRDALNKLQTGEWKLQPPFHILPRHLWLQDTTFGFTKEEIEQANYFIGNRYSIDCYIIN